MRLNARLSTSFVAVAIVVVACGTENAGTATSVLPPVDASSTQQTAFEPGSAPFLTPQAAIEVGSPTRFTVATHCGVDFLWLNGQAWRAEISETWTGAVPTGWLPDGPRPESIEAEFNLIDDSTLVVTAGDDVFAVTYSPDLSVSTQPLCD